MFPRLLRLPVWLSGGLSLGCWSSCGCSLLYSSLNRYSLQSWLTELKKLGQITDKTARDCQEGVSDSFKILTEHATVKRENLITPGFVVKGKKCCIRIFHQILIFHSFTYEFAYTINLLMSIIILTFLTILIL